MSERGGIGLRNGLDENLSTKIGNFLCECGQIRRNSHVDNAELNGLRLNV